VTDTGWWLTALGYRPWPEVFDQLAGLTCAWADYTGFHSGQNPAALVQAPPYSHVWGWSADRLVRVRVDVEDGADVGVVAVLTRDSGYGGGRAEPVQVVERVAAPFKDSFPPARLVQVIGPSPLVFVAGPVPDGNRA
jgi:hypothetical protein